MHDPVELANWSRFEEALASLEAMPAQNRVGLLGHMAGLQLGLHRWQEAVDTLTAYVGANPGDGAAWNRLAIAARNAGCHDRVFEVCDTIGRANAPPILLAMFLLHRARSATALGRTGEALDAAQSAVRIAPDFREAALWARLLQPPPAGGARLLSCLAAPAEFDRLLGGTDWAWPADWMGLGFSREYTTYYFDEAFQDLSFLVLAQDGSPLLQVQCFSAGGLQGYDGGIRIVPRRGCEPDDAAVMLAVDHLRELAGAFGGTPLVFDLPGVEVSAVGRACMKRAVAIETSAVMDLDLAADEDRLLKTVRKSYRPLIRAGGKRFRHELLCRDNQDWGLFEHLVDMHYEHFGGKGGDRLFMTKPLLRRLVAEGRCELAIGFDGARRVSATMTVDEGDTTIYSTGRYSRSATPDPSAWALWSAILRARARGQKRFFLGRLGSAEMASEKAANIAFFKRGFADRVYYLNAWRLRP